MWLIVGLGNPGAQYANTRHNAGFHLIDRLAAKWDVDVATSKFKSLIGETNRNGHKITLMKPQTYMNLSGEAVRAWMDFYKQTPQQIIVVYDDLDLPQGKIRLREKGSSGGHNGIKSIIEHSGTQAFPRIKLGISRPTGAMTVVDYVLSAFSKQERDTMDQGIVRGLEALEFALTNGFHKALPQFNGGPSTEV
jgi:PTH1 family peptidyl-tRNA hydrolase